jgi:ABC-type multidrug transport system fused ATPase/permease subunit
LQANKNLHEKMIESLMRVPAIFYDRTPGGQILNKFTNDIGFLD